MPAIETDSFTKIYPGGAVGIRDLDLVVERGEVAGFVGPNGAGKTTTLRLLLDFLRPTGGRARILGHDTRRESLAVRRRIGYLPADLGFFEGLTGAETLSLFARLRPRTPPRRREELLDALALPAADLRRRVGDYSTGMRRKLGLVVALQHDPELAILDEPTTGLDPLVRHHFWRAIRSWRGRDRTLFLSTHDLLEIDALCDRVLVLRAGTLAAARSVAELRGEADDPRALQEAILEYYVTP